MTNLATHKTNKLKAIRFETPDYIPMSFHINSACWESYNQDELLDLMESHKFLFPNFKRPTTKQKVSCGNVTTKGLDYVDDWGCTWQTTTNGITGTVTKHPLSNWDNFLNYKAPDPMKCTGIGNINWGNTENDIKCIKEKGGLTSGGLRHGHTFLQLCDIRGYENLIFDMMDEEPNLLKLINLIESFNLKIVKNFVNMGVDIIEYPEDLGMQKGPMLSPSNFVKYIKPSYQRLMQPARDKNILVHMHSDGDIRLLVDDIIDGGVDILNLQDLVNGVDWIANKFTGKTCIELDIDRQSITRFGSPKQIDALIHEEVSKLSTKQGGLMMIFGLYPGTPIENVKALMDAMEKYAFYY